MSKFKFSTDSDNRLIFRRDGKNIPVNGTFETEDNNRLIYWLNEPAVWRKQYKFPEKIIFTGRWKLNANYDLELSHSSEQSHSGNLSHSRASGNLETITLKGAIISCESDKLVFEIRSVNKNGLSQFRLLKLTGFWGTDGRNQISFKINKKGPSDTLTFQGAWQLNENQQVIYTYEKAALKRKTKDTHTLVFIGFWQITSANKLTYILSQGTNSKFDFKAQIETPNVYPKKGVIKYRVGMGVREPKAGHIRIISLYGTWKFSRKLGLTFDMEYAKGQINSLSFGTEVNFGKRDQVVFNLINKDKEQLGMSVLFTHRFLRQLDAELFTRLKTSQKESGVDAGIRIPF